MTVSLYDTHTLQGVIRTLFTPSTYWLETFFPSAITFDQEFIDFDVVTGARRMAPFVSPLASGKPQLDKGYSTKRFKPAYVKPKDIIDPNRIIKRRAGEPFFGSLSMGQRRDAVLADVLQNHKDQVIRRLEWMACQAIVTGHTIVTGDDYPTVDVDFGRASANTVTLSGTSLWTDQTNSDPIQDIEDQSIAFQQLTGFVPDRITMGLDAFKAYRTHPKVLAQLNLLQRGTLDNVVTTAVGGGVAQLVGKVGSLQLSIYLYNDIYEDKTSTVASPVYVPYLDPTKVVLTSAAGIQGVRAYGAIMDAQQGYVPAELYVKNWIENDPSVEYVMTQSAPLMVPTNPNCSLTIKAV